jgi:3',5'-cyclic AMP phosphodiesterase CpdA
VRFNAVTSFAATLTITAAATCVAMLAWPASRWLVTIADLASPQRVLSIALANGVVLIAAYLAIAALAWGYADATMLQPRDLDPSVAPPQVSRKWRVVHLSDLHTVGERYGFRIESGRSGPRGNSRLHHVFAQLEQIHAALPIDIILITGDLTDAGRSAEWSELLDALQLHPQLLERMLVLPGNHDVNVVDRSNPARLDLPTSPNRRLRRLRFLSVAELIQGDRVRLIDRAGRRLGENLSNALDAHRAEIARFCDLAKPLLSRRLDDVWSNAFPMIVPPDGGDGLGIILLNSNADTHFSFTNALGMMSSDQMNGIEIATAQYPQACWILAIHHHVVEYPRPASTLSERIGTALVNGSWFVRRLGPIAERSLLMHGHRHTDWFGECAGLRIISAPSPVMEATDSEDTCFYLHTLAVTSERKLCLLGSERIVINGDA